MINELAKKIHLNNIEKGFYEDEKNIGEILALIHSEVSEALEADRIGNHATCFKHNSNKDKQRLLQELEERNEYSIDLFRSTIKTLLGTN